MSELLPPFHFDHYTLRIAQPEDLPLADNWTKADPDHCTMIPWFWVRQSADINSLLLEDEQGPVFFFRMQIMGDGSEVEVHIQFSPEESVAAKERLMDALLKGFSWLENRLAQVGFTTLYFHSRRRALIYFCQKRMGFVWDGRRLERKVTTHGEVKREEEECTAEQRICSAPSAQISH